jgi:hypothetical protein
VGQLLQSQAAFPTHAENSPCSVYRKAAVKKSSEPAAAPIDITLKMPSEEEERLAEPNFAESSSSLSSSEVLQKCRRRFWLLIAPRQRMMRLCRPQFEVIAEADDEDETDYL